MKTALLKISKAALLFIILTISQTANAQAPQKMSFQAVVRNGSNTLITSAPVGMKISILRGSATGTAVYVETQTPTTNSNGLVSLEIGTGTIVTGTFSGINWANGPYFIKTETDPLGGNSYTISGTSELMSVPYALFSANSIPGPQGPIGLTGPTGSTGATGPAGTTNYTFLTKTVNYTITNTDMSNNLVLINTTTNTDLTFTLPLANSVVAGRVAFISGSSISNFQSINVLTSGTDTLLGIYTPVGTTNLNTAIGAYASWVQLVSDGVSKWYVIGLYF
ncbi:collagen-like protein [Flavobacterium sp.]|uniref:collagen-like triple helix repeat-containing protein n=1 Tax=Flavobacterium sp. TaxID=239 RepID=UPI0038FC6AF5